MCGDEQKPTATYSYVTLARRIAANRPARAMGAMVDRALERMDAQLEQLY